jgi:tetratricopeptide (TPR) repeat protein
MAAAFERQLFHAKRVGAARLEEEARSMLVSSQVFGPTSAQEAIEYCERQLQEIPDRAFQTHVMRRLALLYAMRGGIEKALDLLNTSSDFFLEAGLDVVEAAGRMADARIEWYAGNLELAQERARVGLEELTRLGDHTYAGTMALYLAIYLEEQGSIEEAEAALRRARQLTNRAEISDAVGLDAVEARLLARRGELADAERRARNARRAADSTDLHEARLRAASSLAFVLELAGRTSEAYEQLEYALSVAEAKGDIVSAGRIRTRMDELVGVGGAK